MKPDFTLTISAKEPVCDPAVWKALFEGIEQGKKSYGRLTDSGEMELSSAPNPVLANEFGKSLLLYKEINKDGPDTFSIEFVQKKHSAVLSLPEKAGGRDAAILMFIMACILNGVQNHLCFSDSELSFKDVLITHTDGNLVSLFLNMTDSPVNIGTVYFQNEQLNLAKNKLKPIYKKMGALHAKAKNRICKGSMTRQDVKHIEAALHQHPQFQKLKEEALNQEKNLYLEGRWMHSAQNEMQKQNHARLSLLVMLLEGILKKREEYNKVLDMIFHTFLYDENTKKADVELLTMLNYMASMVRPEEGPLSILECLAWSKILLLFMNSHTVYLDEGLTFCANALLESVESNTQKITGKELDAFYDFLCWVIQTYWTDPVEPALAVNLYSAGTLLLEKSPKGAKKNRVDLAMHALQHGMDLDGTIHMSSGQQVKLMEMDASEPLLVLLKSNPQLCRKEKHLVCLALLPVMKAISKDPEGRKQILSIADLLLDDFIKTHDSQPVPAPVWRDAATEFFEAIMDMQSEFPLEKENRQRNERFFEWTQKIADNEGLLLKREAVVYQNAARNLFRTSQDVKTALEVLHVIEQTMDRQPGQFAECRVFAMVDLLMQADFSKTITKEQYAMLTTFAWELQKLAFVLSEYALQTAQKLLMGSAAAALDAGMPYAALSVIHALSDINPEARMTEPLVRAMIPETMASNSKSNTGLSSGPKPRRKKPSKTKPIPKWKQKRSTQALHLEASTTLAAAQQAFMNNPAEACQPILRIAALLKEAEPESLQEIRMQAGLEIQLSLMLISCGFMEQGIEWVEKAAFSIDASQKEMPDESGSGGTEKQQEQQPDMHQLLMGLYLQAGQIEKAAAAAHQVMDKLISEKNGLSGINSCQDYGAALYDLIQNNETSDLYAQLQPLLSQFYLFSEADQKNPEILSWLIPLMDKIAQLLLEDEKWDECIFLASHIIEITSKAETEQIRSYIRTAQRIWMNALIGQGNKEEALDVSKQILAEGPSGMALDDALAYYAALCFDEASKPAAVPAAEKRKPVVKPGRGRKKKARKVNKTPENPMTAFLASSHHRGSQWDRQLLEDLICENLHQYPHPDPEWKTLTDKLFSNEEKANNDSEKQHNDIWMAGCLLFDLVQCQTLLQVIQNDASITEAKQLLEAIAKTQHIQMKGQISRLTSLHEISVFILGDHPDQQISTMKQAALKTDLQSASQNLQEFQTQWQFIVWYFLFCTALQISQIQEVQEALSQMVEIYAEYGLQSEKSSWSLPRTALLFAYLFGAQMMLLHFSFQEANTAFNQARELYQTMEFFASEYDSMLLDALLERIKILSLNLAASSEQAEARKKEIEKWQQELRRIPLSNNPKRIVHEEVSSGENGISGD